jgi:hypothetical protein
MTENSPPPTKKGPGWPCEGANRVLRIESHSVPGSHGRCRRRYDGQYWAGSAVRCLLRTPWCESCKLPAMGKGCQTPAATLLDFKPPTFPTSFLETDFWTQAVTDSRRCFEALLICGRRYSKISKCTSRAKSPDDPEGIAQHAESRRKAASNRVTLLACSQLRAAAL